MVKIFISKYDLVWMIYARFQIPEGQVTQGFNLKNQMVFINSLRYSLRIRALDKNP